MKHECDYCGGHTLDDKRGNCVACGAPRIKPPDVLEKYAREWEIDSTLVQAFPYQHWYSRMKPWNTNGG